MKPRSEGGGDDSDGNKADNESDTMWDGIDEDLENGQALYVTYFCSFGLANDITWTPVPLTILLRMATVKKSLAWVMFSLMLKMMALQS
jgi:hypothetical protein